MFRGLPAIGGKLLWVFAADSAVEGFDFLHVGFEVAAWVKEAGDACFFLAEIEIAQRNRHLAPSAM